MSKADCQDAKPKLTLDAHEGTEEIRHFPCTVDGMNVVLVDTPGFNDTNQGERSDSDILSSLMDWMKEAYEDGMYFAGILYLYPINEARMTGSNRRNLDMFEKLCGSDKLKHVMMVTTKWSWPPAPEELTREGQLRDEFWKLYVEAGSMIRRFERPDVSVEELIREIFELQGERFVPQIQQEALAGKRLRDTAAGTFLESAFKEWAKKQEKELEGLRRELQLARKAGKYGYH